MRRMRGIGDETRAPRERSAGASNCFGSRIFEIGSVFRGAKRPTPPRIHKMSSAEIPGIYVLDVLNLARRWKVRPDALLAGTGLTEEALRDPGARVPLATCTRVIERAHQLTGEPALAL